MSSLSSPWIPGDFCSHALFWPKVPASWVLELLPSLLLDCSHFCLCCADPKWKSVALADFHKPSLVMHLCAADSRKVWGDRLFTGRISNHLALVIGRSSPYMSLGCLAQDTAWWPLFPSGARLVAQHLSLLPTQGLHNPEMGIGDKGVQKASTLFGHGEL